MSNETENNNSYDTESLIDVHLSAELFEMLNGDVIIMK